MVSVSKLLAMQWDCVEKGGAASRRPASYSLDGSVRACLLETRWLVFGAPVPAQLIRPRHRSFRALTVRQSRAVERKVARSSGKGRRALGLDIAIGIDSLESVSTG